jgi:hypothetical protein
MKDAVGNVRERHEARGARAKDAGWGGWQAGRRARASEGRAAPRLRALPGRWAWGDTWDEDEG